MTPGSRMPGSAPAGWPRVLVALLWVLCSAAGFSAPPAAEVPKATPEARDFFESRIRPVLDAECFACHSAKSEKLRGGLRLDARARMLAGGESGPAIVPGNPDASRLIQAVRYKDHETAMPPKKPLSAAQVADLETWVRMGGPWPGDDDPVPAAPTPAAPRDWPGLRSGHWAFRKVTQPALPVVRDARWCRNPIDRFVLAGLEAAGLRPSPPADRPTLIRRASLDLTGLPPTPEEVEAFVADRAEDAFEKVVDRLLASPRHGERWGRHWLDVARYSDGFGGFLDGESLPHAWHYRDWVVAALNHDLPYDEFVREQIAGGLASHDRAADVATGFFALGPTYISDGGDAAAQAQAQAETLADRVDTFSRAFLGLTVACARCHDHKFDPIEARDYYAIAGIFNNTRNQIVPLAPPAIVAEFDRAHRAIREKEKAVAAANPASRDALKAELERLRAAAPAPYPAAHVLAEAGTNDMAVAIRGDLRRPGEPAPRRFLRILSADDAPRFTGGSGLRQLAEATVDPANPLTARVMVNRVWKHHFGQALVRTPSNFGILGEKPTHPELLDWLAATFVRNGWSLKRLHRMILLSSTWQMGSHHDAAAFARDGENRLLWRVNPRKLEVESWRDSQLAVTGELDPTMGGAPTDRILEEPRRTLYGTVSRNGDRSASDDLLRLFDFPAARSTSETRATSTVPQQYLFLMNSPFMAARATALSLRLHRERPDDGARIDRAYRLLYARPPSTDERALGLRFLGDDPRARWESYAQALLSAHEFMQIP